MYDRLSVCQDKELLKTLLFELSIATTTFQMGNEQEWAPADMTCDIEEIILLYDNSEGNISMGLRRTDPQNTQNTRFFPLVFHGLNRFFTGRVILYTCFRAIFGTSITIEFLGSIPPLPSILGETLAGRANLSLQNASRYAILLSRASSYMQAIGKFALNCSAAHYAFLYFYPILARSSQGIQDINCPALLRLWLNLKAQNLERYEEQRSRLKFKCHFPQKIAVDRNAVKYLRYISYNAFNYLDDQFSNVKG